MARYTASDLRTWLAGLTLSRAPGVEWEYSNVGYGSPLEAPAQALLSVRRPAPAIGGDQALGWEVAAGSDPFIAKDGVTAGQAASIVLDASKQTGVVVLSNTLPVQMKRPPDGGIGAADLARHLIRPARPLG